MRCAMPRVASVCRHRVQSGARGLDFLRDGHHRQHDLERPVRRGAGSARNCTANTSGRASDRRRPRSAEERVGFALGRQPGDGLVAARVQRADADRAAGRRIHDAAIGGVLGCLVGQAGAGEQKLGAHHADAVADRRIEPVQVARVGQVQQQPDGLAVGGHGGRLSSGRIDRAPRRRRASLRPASRARRPHPGSARSRPALAVEPRLGMAGSGERRPSPTTIGTPRARASMARWLASLPADERDAAAAAPVEFQEARRRQVVGRPGSRRVARRQAPAAAAPARRAQHAVAQGP